MVRPSLLNCRFIILFSPMSTFKTSRAKENILRKVRQALQEETMPLPFPEAEKQQDVKVFKSEDELLPDERFALAFTKAGGNFVFCNDYAELVTSIGELAKKREWKEVLCANKPLFSLLVNNKLAFIREFNPAHEEADACITDCEAAVARTGTFVFSSRQNHGRVAPVFFPVHIVVVTPNQILNDIENALNMVQRKYNGQLPSMLNFNTGPSRTADIEKTLVTGVHGPKEVFCFYVNQV